MPEENSDLAQIKKELSEFNKILDSFKENDFSPTLAEKKESFLFNSYRSLRELKANFVREFQSLKQNNNDLSFTSENLTEIAKKNLDSAETSSINAKKVAESTNLLKEKMFTISAAAEELSTNMKNVSENTQQSSDSAHDITSETENVTQSINKINQSTENASQVVLNAVDKINNTDKIMKDLQKASNDIQTVTDTISTISDQTKLLALNATIEAARAGKEGIRFAVVANEVKELAGKTNNATKSIFQQVNSMKSAVDNSTNEISVISNIIQELKNIISDISQSVDEQTSSTANISTNISQVAQNLENVSLTVSEAASAIQEVTQNITESATLSDEISESINKISDHSATIRSDSSILYANVMEISSINDDMTQILNKIKLPANITIEKAQRDNLFRFTSNFSVNVKAIDKEHKGIVDFINKIHSAIKNQKDTEHILLILKDMADWVIDHFAHEENLMAQVSYPDLEKHKKIHEKLLNDVSISTQKIESGEQINLIELLSFLKKWLVNHILGTDKKYSKSLNDNGIF